MSQGVAAVAIDICYQQWVCIGLDLLSSATFYAGFFLLAWRVARWLLSAIQ